MSPRWAAIRNCSLYFYGSERHRPHVDVRGPGFDATLDLETSEVLAGWIPPKELRRVRRLLDQHRELAIEAFRRTLDLDFPGTLEQQLEERR